MAELNSPRFHFDFNTMSSATHGDLDDCTIFASDGRSYSVEGIILEKPQLWRWFLRRAGYLFVFADDVKEPWVRIDLDLSEERHYSVDELREELHGLIMRHPKWWRRHSSEMAIATMFGGCTSIPEIIDQIGVLDTGPRKPRAKASTKVIDLRGSPGIQL